MLVDNSALASSHEHVKSVNAFALTSSIEIAASEITKLERSGYLTRCEL
jgi:hypothetical protein